MTEQATRTRGTGTRAMRHPLLPAWVCAAVRDGGAGWNSAVEAQVRTGSASGRAQCRACGERIAKGAPVYALWYACSAAAEVRPELLIKCYLHAPCCTATR